MALDKDAREIIRILSEMDVDAALKNAALRGFIPDEREYAIAGIHKARLAQRRYFTRKQIQESKEWLRNNGFKEKINER